MNRTDITPQQQRENAEPIEGSSPIPWFVVVLVGCLVSLCIV